MSTSTKIWLIAAALLVVIGLVVFSAAMFAGNWDFTRLNSDKYETNTHEISEKFSDISVTTETAEVVFLPSTDGKCTVVAYETEKIRHTVSVQNGTLTVKITDLRHWYEKIVFFSIGTPKITVYLPESQYGSLDVTTDTGDVEIPKDFSFESIRISTDTGDISSNAPSAGSIKIDTDTGDISSNAPSAGSVTAATDTGDININSAEIDGNIHIETDTGRVKLSKVNCNSLDVESDTGDVTLSDVTSGGRFSVENGTGDVRFERSDAAEIFVETDTGDVTGTLLSEKVFLVETDTGDVDVPKSVTGGRCEITTDTGDVELTVVGSR